MARKLVRDMTPEEHEAYKRELQEKKDKIRSMTEEERAEYEKRRQRKWSDDYIKRSYDTINFRTPKGGREVIRDFAAEIGLTMNDFIRKMICEGMIKEGYSFDPTKIFPEAVMPDSIVPEENGKK